MQTQTMPTFGVGEPTASPAPQQVAPQVLPVGTATLNGTVSHYQKIFLVQMFCECLRQGSMWSDGCQDCNLILV